MVAGAASKNNVLGCCQQWQNQTFNDAPHGNTRSRLCIT